MKHTILAALLLIFSISCASAAEIWSIGVEDNNYQEFAIAGNFNEFPNNFSRSPAVQIGSLNAKTDWPYIHPGPADAWAGSKPHTFTIQFDLPQDFVISSSSYELILKGWGHAGAAPRFDVNLNGWRGVIQTEQNSSRGDAILTNPNAAKSQTFSLVLPCYTVNPTGNVLTLTNSVGAWFIYDCVRFRSTTGRIEAIQVLGQPGIHNQGNPSVPGRRILVNYQGETLKLPAWLNVEYTAENSEAKRRRVMINPDDHASEVVVFLPLDEATSAKPLKVVAVLDLRGRKVTAQADLPAVR